MLIIKLCSFLNGLGKKCEVGKDCPANQVCNKEKCIFCEEGSKPNESQLKCNGATRESKRSGENSDTFTLTCT